MPPSDSANHVSTPPWHSQLFPNVSFSIPLDPSNEYQYSPFHSTAEDKPSPHRRTYSSTLESGPSNTPPSSGGGLGARVGAVLSNPKGKMADPFEVRMRFTTQLQHLNASATSAQKAAHYALKYRDMDEDLHSCILEQLEKNNMNNRANILYFIEHLIDSATKENHLEFVRMMQRDILRVVDAVAPPDGSGAANVKVVRRVLTSLASKNVLDQSTVNEIEECLKERETHPAHMALSPMAVDQEGADGDKLNVPGSAGMKGNRANGVPANIVGTGMKLDKRQIEQRIEEDRERNKRLRESVWTVSGEDDVEANMMWEEGSELNEDDYLMAEDEAADRAAMVDAEKSNFGGRWD